MDVGGSGSYQVYPEGRGLFIPVKQNPGGGLTYGTPYVRRTPVFFQTDLALVHSFGVSRAHEAWRIGLEVNATNVMNVKRATIFGTKINSPNSTNFLKPAGYNTPSAGEPTIQGVNYAVLEGGYDYKALSTTPGVAGAAPLTLNNQYGVATGYQTGRQMRFKFKFIF
jgi:hypothetical protein